VEVVIEGRTGKQISFLTRQADEEGSEWEPELLATEDAEPAGERGLKFHVPLSRIMHPLEYRVSAGGNSSETYKVQVLYPLKIVKIQSSVKSPEYTGLTEAVTESGNVTGLVGSQLKVQFELDRAAEVAQACNAFMRRRYDRCRLVVENSLEIGRREQRGDSVESQTTLVEQSLRALAEPI